MEDTRRLKNAFEDVYGFMNPVLQREEIQKSRGHSLVEILNRALPEGYGGGGTSREKVIQRSLDLLNAIHDAFVNPEPPSEEAHTPDPQPNAEFQDAKRRRALHALLDLISLEGIYPSLSEGVGIPLEQRVISMLPTGVIAKQSRTLVENKPQEEKFLLKILNSLRLILNDSRPSIQPILVGRILSDLIAGTAELAFNSQSLAQQDVDTCRDLFLKIINETPSPSLLPVLSSFLQTNPASWFKNKISSQLSKVPLRNDGVLQTITFLATQFAPTLGNDVEANQPNGSLITVQAIMQISRLLSSVPQDLSPDEYFTNLCPKLLSLLDGDDEDLKKTASYVIGNGILGKRSYGAPGTIGHDIFMKPLFEALNGNLSDSATFWLRKFNRDGSALPKDTTNNFRGAILVKEWQLHLALNRLIALSLLHPHPGLLKRLIGPVLLPLWGLQWYAKIHKKDWWKEQAFTLLQTFFSVSVGKSRFEKLINHIMWDGGITWTYGPGEEGGISLRKRRDSASDKMNIIEIIDTMEERVEIFLKLLEADPQREDLTGDVFLYATKHWLLCEPKEHIGNQMEESHVAQQPLRKLACAKIAEKLISEYKDAISRHPLHILALINQLIESEIAPKFQTKPSAGDTKSPTLESIGNIVGGNKDDIGSSEKHLNTAEPSEALSAAFSLLSTILTSPDFQVSESIKLLLQTMKIKLDELLPVMTSSLVQPATTASMLLEFSLSDSLSTGAKPASNPSHISDIETHRQALGNLTSQAPPVKAEGLSLLSQLITKSSPVLDIPSTLALLLSLITNGNESTENDEFVYLNVIKLIGVLASKHPRTVVKTLAERYADRNEENTLDQRLMVGEALLRTVQGLGDALIEDTAHVLGDTMLSVAGRRGGKPKAKQDRAKQDLTTEPLESDDADIEDLGVEAADMMNQLDDLTDSEAEDPERTAYSKRILQSWAAGAVSDSNPDDLRVRTSAMSILASAIQTNLAALGKSIASSSVDMALSTLTLEPGPENAILRRAAIILLLDLVKAVDAALDVGKDLGFGFSSLTPSGYTADQGNNGTIGNIPDMLRVLTFVESKETDVIVRGHIRVLIESLEAWVEKSLLRGIGIDNQPRFELGDKLAGLDIEPLSALGNGGSRRVNNRPRIEEIE